MHHQNYATDDKFIENHSLNDDFIFYVNCQMIDDSNAIQMPKICSENNERGTNLSPAKVVNSLPH